MGLDKYTVCDICGASVKARGIGGHKALVHGVVEKVIIRDSSTRVDDSGTRVQRPGDYVKKKSEVLQVRRESALKLVSEGRILCNGGCLEWFDSEELIDGLCWGCRPENK